MLERGDEVLRRTVTLAGTATAMEKAFSVELTEFDHDDRSYRGHGGPLQIPQQYASLVSGVFGLDYSAVAKPHFRIRNADGGSFGARAKNVSYSPVEIARLLRVSCRCNRAGQTIAILELGGGYRPAADITAYFKSLGIQAPAVKAVLVDLAKNRPTNAQSADGEVMLDIEVAGAVAPDASIAVCFAPNTLAWLPGCSQYRGP